MSAPTVARKKSAKLTEFKIELKGKRREDGSLFVTSPNLGPFSAVIEDGNWDDVIPFLRKFLEANFGRVRDLRLIRDASELMPLKVEPPAGMPDAYIIAEVAQHRAARTT